MSCGTWSSVCWAALTRQSRLEPSTSSACPCPALKDRSVVKSVLRWWIQPRSQNSYQNNLLLAPFCLFHNAQWASWLIYCCFVDYTYCVLRSISDKSPSSRKLVDSAALQMLFQVSLETVRRYWESFFHYSFGVAVGRVACLPTPVWTRTRLQEE